MKYQIINIKYYDKILKSNENKTLWVLDIPRVEDSLCIYLKDTDRVIDGVVKSVTWTACDDYNICGSPEVIVFLETYGDILP